MARGNAASAARKVEMFAMKLASLDRVERRATEEIMQDFVVRVRAGFDRTADPYGRRWKPRKSGGGKVLTGPTRKLKTWKVVRVVGNRYRLKTKGEAYFGFHRGGTSRMPQRAMLPINGELPSSWKSAAQKIMRKRMGDHMRR